MRLQRLLQMFSFPIRQTMSKTSKEPTNFFEARFYARHESMVGFHQQL